MTLFEMMERFPDDETCRQHLISIRWPDGVRCPRCECQRVSNLPKRKQWTCLGCRYRFSAISGTIFENSKIRLRRWFIAILMLIVSKKSQSSLQMNRQLGVSQECCWHMLHRLREAMRERADEREAFTGTVQADEFYLGGEPRKANKHRKPFGVDGRRTSLIMGRNTPKQPILGVVHPETGKVRTAAVQAVRAGEMEPHLHEWCDVEQTDLHSDELSTYVSLGKQFRSHEVICHRDEYVRDDGMNTNAIESAWSLFARAVFGSFHRVSRKHLGLYLGEFESRFNTRDIPHERFFDVILRRAIGRQLPLRQLCGPVVSRPKAPARK